MVLRQEDLPVFPLGPAAPLWWAMILFVLIDGVIFATLISSYLYLRFVNAVWPPEGTALPDPWLAGIAGLVLLASSAAYLWGDYGLRRGEVRRLQLGLALAVALALGFLVLQGVERALVDYRWDTHAYGSIVWATILLHMTHVLALVIMGVLLWVLARQAYFTRDRRRGIWMIGLFWHFVALVWIPLFVVLYLLPYGF